MNKKELAQEKTTIYAVIEKDNSDTETYEEIISLRLFLDYGDALVAFANKKHNKNYYETMIVLEEGMFNQFDNFDKNENELTSEDFDFQGVENLMVKEN